MTIHLAHDRPVLRKEPRKRRPIYETLLTGAAVISSGLTGLALVEIFEPKTFAEWAKVGTAVAGIGIVAFAVNRIATKSAADLAVKGLNVTGVAAVGAMTFVGFNLAATTYAGFTLDPTERLRLEQHGALLSQQAGDNSRIVSPAAQAVPIVRGIANDWGTKAECEPKDSCVSGKRNGGRGPVTRQLTLLKERADTVAGQVEASLGAGHERANLVGPLYARYNAVLAGPGSARSKRAELQQIDAQIRDALGGRSAGDPAAVIAAYAAELERPVNIQGQPEAARALTEIQLTHAGNLKRALAVPVKKEAALPAFPSRTGVTDTLSFIGHFWPVAAIALVIDAVFPMLFWICVYSTKWWQVYQQEPPVKAAPREDELDLAAQPKVRRAIHPAFDPEAYFPSLTPTNRNRLAHHELGGRDAD